MQELFTAVFYQPLLNLLIWTYNILPNHDLGLSIIILTILVKLALYPLSWKQLESQKQLQDIQPKIEALKAQYKDDKQGLAQAQMKFFKEEKINPLSSCLPLLVQLPFLIALFYVFTNGLKDEGYANLLYPFIQNPGTLNHTFLGLFSLSQSQNIILAVIVGGIQFWQSKLMIAKRPPKVPGSKDEDMAAVMSKQMMFFMPIITGVMTYQFPSGLGLYWFFQTVLAIGQQYLFNMTAGPRSSTDRTPHS
ncbi:membrane protein insertase YidC [Candidatus Uhrbacteria bacterium]|nr:membrane protein insertase YidC [Candidatus Uhrbacteria bacterium]